LNLWKSITVPKTIESFPDMQPTVKIWWF